MAWDLHGGIHTNVSNETLIDQLIDNPNVKRGKTPHKRLLEYDSSVTLKQVNSCISDIGYKLVYYGHDLSTGFLYFQVVPLRMMYGTPPDPFVRVYAVGDLPLNIWRRRIWEVLRQTRGCKPDLHQRAYRRIRKRKYGI
jgi:hypothetical protein